MANDTVLFRAEFDEKWKTYYMLQITIAFAASIVGLVLVPFWLLGWGQWYSRRFFTSLECVLGEKSLRVGRGVWFRTEKTIPLDKIQDLTLKDGPLLNAFGLSSLKVETAGQSQPGSEADLVGVVEARAFRDRVLKQRDLLASRESVADAGSASASGTEALLTEIRDSLIRIEERLDKTSG